MRNQKKKKPNQQPLYPHQSQRRALSKLLQKGKSESGKQQLKKQKERYNLRPKKALIGQEQGLDLSDVDEDPRARRERERAAELAADLETAKELFATTKIKSANGDSTDDINTFRPRTKEEFDEFSKRLTAIITSVSELPHYAMFVVGLVKAIAEPLGSEDVKKIASGLTALGNEKLKAEKGPGGKAKKAKKPTLVVGAAKSAAPKFDTRNYGDDDDFDDFMVSAH